MTFMKSVVISLLITATAWAVSKPNIIVIYTDDHGYSDLSCQGVFPDVKTPHIDALAVGGVRMTDGYVTAPQCVPSRGGLLSGQYQNKFGLESNGINLDGFNRILTVAERLKQAGYTTGMAGKWHLGPGDKITEHGFDKVFYKNSNRPGTANIDLQGNDVALGPEKTGMYHLDACSSVACSFIERFQDKPFFFYLAYRAPHVPLDPPQKYLDRFPGKMPERRRKALAMLSAVDDGVGQITATLRANNLEEKTLIFVISDNGAPLKIHKKDAFGGGPGWDGSLNDPMNGEKGMLTEGGIRTPFVVSWKGTIPAGQIYSHPVISLDVAATANALAGLPNDAKLDGVNLIPYLTGENDQAPHDVLYWRWVGQAAMRQGKWKYLTGGGREYLFDLVADKEEQHNLLKQYPELAQRMHVNLKTWSRTLKPQGLSERNTQAGSRFFDWYLEGKKVAPTVPRRQPTPKQRQRRVLQKNRSGSSTQTQNMNVIFILADDLGWADTTLYGHTRFYETPNLERLAQRGMTFTRAYANSPLCSPTRASIMTGQTPARHGSTAPQHHTGSVRLKASVAKSAPPGNKALQTQSVTRLDTAYPTLAKLLKARGYATGHFGKWHLGPEPYSPLEHGFDVDIPHHPGPGPAGSFVAPWKFKNFKENYPKEHIEDRMAAEAVKWIQTVKDKPFYMNYWQFSVHAPFDAKAALIEKYRGKVNPNDPQHCPTYAAMVESLDDAIGTLLDAVDAAGIAEHTAIVFISDNGGNMYNQVEGVRPTSNRPLRGGKATLYEGGIRVPCVVVWPGVTQRASRSHEIIQTSDFYPTILKQFEISLPEGHVVDGIDITPALQGDALERESIYTYFPHSPPVPDWLPPAMAVHADDWKLIRLFHEGNHGKHGYLLYNLTQDIGETQNLAARYPEKVAALDRMIETYIQQAKTVVPQPNPKFDPSKYQPEKVGVPSERNRLNGQR